MTQQTLWSATWPQKSSLAGSSRQQVQWRKRFRVSNTRKSSEQPEMDGRAWVVRNRCGGQELKVNPGESWSLGSWGVSKSTSVLPRPLGKASKVPGQDGNGWSRRSWPVVDGAAWDFVPPTFGIRPPPYPFKSHSMEARQLLQVWHVWGAWYTAAHSQRLPQSSGTGNVHMEAWPGSSCHSKGSGEGRRSCKPRIRRERRGQTHPFCVRRRWHWPESWQATEESQDHTRRLQLEGRIWLIWQVCFTSCGSHYTSPPWPGYMIWRCQSPHHWGTHSSIGRTHAGSKRAQENQVRPPYDRVCGKQWQVHCLPFEVGCCGFVGTSLMTFLHKLGITHRERKSVCKAASNAALRASTWIWAKHRNGPSWCHQAPVRSGSGVSALVHWLTSPMWYWV